MLDTPYPAVVPANTVKYDDYSEHTSTMRRDVDRACQLLREGKWHDAWMAFQRLTDSVEAVERWAWMKAYKESRR